MNRRSIKIYAYTILLAVTCCFLLQQLNVYALNLSDIPEYSDESYTIINKNVPDFSDDELSADSFEYYSAQDNLGRCGTAYANICKEIMPTEERGAIGDIKPSGWHTIKYDVIADRYLYNRCHLIGYQLSGENDNPLNLITGTRYLNVEGMEPFENQIADYAAETGNHVLYRVTPIYDGDNLLASGVQMEAKSVEDNGAGVEFNVYCYNVQPGIWIDYATGDSTLEEDRTEVSSEIEMQSSEQTEQTSAGGTYILNTNTKKFHYLYCNSVDQMKEKNKQEYTGSRDEIIGMGYKPCGNCHP